METIDDIILINRTFNERNLNKKIKKNIKEHYVVKTKQTKVISPISP